MLRIEGDEEEQQADQEKGDCDDESRDHESTAIQAAHVIRDAAPPDREQQEGEGEIVKGHGIACEGCRGDEADEKRQQAEKDTTHVDTVPPLVDAIPE